MSSSSNSNNSNSGDIAATPLPRKVAGDVMAGSVVAFCVAPFLTIVDKAIVERSAGTKTLVQSGLNSAKTMLQNPVAYYRSPTFLLMWAVYASTYSTANALRTVAEHDFATTTATTPTSKALIRRRTHDPTSSSLLRDHNPVTSVLAGPYSLFFGTAFVNCGASLMKDRAYARMFGVSNSSAIPKTTYAMWMFRDFTVVGSSFVLPDLVARKIVERNPHEQQNYDAIKKMTQLVLPIASQFVAGPFHFLGLDFYNRNLGHKSWAAALQDRARALQKGFTPVVSARIARIAPGYSMGGVLNTSLRDGWREHVTVVESTQLPSATGKDDVPILGVMATTGKVNSE